MGVPPVGSSGSDAYRRVKDDDDKQGGGKSAPTPDNNGIPDWVLSNDPFEEEMNKHPDGPLKDEIRFQMNNHSGGV